MPRRTRRSLATAAVLCGMFVSAIEMTIVGTAMPRIAGALEGSDRFAWVLSIYLLANTVAAPLSGKLADVLGRKPVYQLAMLAFLLGSALSGAAPTMTWLICARAVQGLGGGALSTVALTIVGDLYTPVERGRVQGLFSAVWGTAGAVGPLAGGFIVDHLGWRWIFYINIPFGLAAMVLLGLALHERVERRAVALDVAGLALLAAAVTALQLAGDVDHGGGGARPGGQSAALALVGVGLLGVFAVVERRAREPVLPLSMLGHRLIGTALLASLLSGAVMFGATNFVPLFVQGVEGSSARAAGAVMTPLALAWPVMGVAAGLLIARLDPRILVRTGTALVAVGAALLTVARPGASARYFLAAGLLIGGGMGLSSTPLLICVQAAVPWEARGIATAAFSFCRTLGGTLGVVLAGTVQSMRLAARDVSPATIDTMLRPGAALGDPAARAALAYAMRGTFVSVAVVAALALLAAFAFPRVPIVRAGQPAPGGSTSH